MFKINGRYTTASVMIDGVDPACVAQITRMVNHPAFDEPVAIMPDCHAGKGSVVGFTMPLGRKVVPNVVGVDIGCGMSMWSLAREALDHAEAALPRLDRQIRDRIPFGREVHARPVHDDDRLNAFLRETARHVAEFERNFAQKRGARIRSTWTGDFESLFAFGDVCERVGADFARVRNSVGTLGGGNHFIEFAVSESRPDRAFVIIHSGSRHFGKAVCDRWQKFAHQRAREDRRAEFRRELDAFVASAADRRDINAEAQRLRRKYGFHEQAPNELDYLEGDDAAGYLVDMVVAQRYATWNRQTMGETIGDVLHEAVGPDVADFRFELETVHNYIDFGDLVIRKGAVPAAAGEVFLVPMNMRDGSLLCVGKGNTEWNCSGPHGAGRALSRSQAKRELSIDDFAATMKQAGVFSSSVNLATLDEAPDAYKPAERILEAIAPTADVADRLFPIMNLKAGE